MHRVIFILGYNNKSLEILGDFANEKKNSRRNALNKLKEFFIDQELIGKINKHNKIVSQKYKFNFSNFILLWDKAILNKDVKGLEELITIANKNAKNFNTEEINTLYNSLLFCMNKEFSETAANRLYTEVKLSDKEFPIKQSCEYYIKHRFLLFCETMEQIMNVALDDKRLLKQSRERLKSPKAKQHGQNGFCYKLIPASNHDNKYLPSLLPDERSSEFKDNDIISKEDFVLIRNIDDKTFSNIGTILGIDADYTTTIKVLVKINESENSCYEVIKLTSGRSYNVLSKALINFVKGESICDKLRFIITSLNDQKDVKLLIKLSNETKYELPSDFKFINDDLTDSQKKAIKAAMQRRVTLIQGPPGTGKTKTAAEIVREWLNISSENSILVTADSNIAVNNLQNALTRIGIKSIRIGQNSNVKEYFGLFSEATSGKTWSTFKKSKNEIKVVCATCIGSESTPKPQNPKTPKPQRIEIKFLFKFITWQQRYFQVLRIVSQLIFSCGFRIGSTDGIQE